MFVSAVSQQAHLALLDPSVGPCLDCFMPKVKDRTGNSCEVLGVSPTITGLAGALGASIAIRHLLGKATDNSHYLLTVDLEGPEFLRNKIMKRSTCLTCGDFQQEEPSMSPTITSLCGERTANVVPIDNRDYDLSGISRKLSPTDILLNSKFVLVFRYGAHNVSVFPSGRLLISEIDEEAQASQIASEVWDMIAES